MTNTIHYDIMTHKLRHFFQDQKGYIEVPAQSRLSILAACEDPKTISKYNLAHIPYPLPQTGQLWLEYELLKNPQWNGVFCMTTSYRDEPSIIEGRHQRIFPLFEFESFGDVNELKKIEAELLTYLGFQRPVSIFYEETCRKYNYPCLEAEHEDTLMNDYGNVISLEKFPKRSQPFWNMKRTPDGLFNKVDIILYGMETFGSAERSTNADEMRDQFFAVSDGQYAQLLFDTCGKDRVLQELNEYLSLPFVPRFGTGIGLTRLEHAMEKANLFDIPIPCTQPSSSVKQCSL